MDEVDEQNRIIEHQIKQMLLQQQKLRDEGAELSHQMIKIKEERLLTGPASCADKKNTTKPCHRGDFPPGQPSLSEARNHQPTFV